MKRMKKIMAIALALVTVATASMGVPATAQAASKTVKAAKSYKKAAVVKKGTTVVKMKNNFYYVKFKAPKAGRYKLTLSDMKSVGGGEIGYGTLYVRKQTAAGYEPFIQQVKTNAGKMTSGIHMCTKYCWQRFDKAKYKGSEYDSLYTRTASIKLKKGETIYVNGSFAGSRTAFTYKVTIKKVK